jgi:16S rRNA processing protein RimM
MPAAATDEWVQLAAITAPHGVSGRVKVKSFTEPARAFAGYGPLTDARGTGYRFRVTGEAQGLFIIEIEGITRREQADLLRGTALGVARSQLPATQNPNEFYLSDLIGLAVQQGDGSAFGTVVDVQNFGAGDLLEIALANDTTEWFSFTHATFPEIDVAAGRITIDPPMLLGSREEESAGGDAA